MARSEKILLALCSVFVLVFGSLIFILPQKDFSDGENRYLTRLSPPDLQTLFNGEYSKKLSSFYTDQFPLRRYATSLYSLTERALGKREINGVISYNNHLIARSDESEEHITIPFPTLLIESKYTLFKEDGDKLAYYYRTDHHRTTEGAYLTYLNACKLLDVTPYPEAYFTKQTVSKDFFGTAFFRSCLPKAAVSPDTIELYRYENDQNVTVTVQDTSTKFHGFYDLSKLDTTDKYAVFLGGNYAHASVFSSSEKPTLLLFKDSFANAVVPFLALHFNIELIDPRYATKSQMSQIFNDRNYDACLLIACMDSFDS